MVLRVYCFRYSVSLYGDLKRVCIVYFLLFSFVHVLIQFFMMPLIPNLIGYVTSVRIIYGWECRVLWRQKKPVGPEKCMVSGTETYWKLTVHEG